MFLKMEERKDKPIPYTEINKKGYQYVVVQAEMRTKIFVKISQKSYKWGLQNHQSTCLKV